MKALKKIALLFIIYLTALFSGNCQTGCRTVIKDSLFCFTGECAKRVLVVYAERDSLRKDIKDLQGIISSKDSVEHLLKERLKESKEYAEKCTTVCDTLFKAYERNTLALEKERKRKKRYIYGSVLAFLAGMLL